MDAQFLNSSRTATEIIITTVAVLLQVPGKPSDARRFINFNLLYQTAGF
jgi:hypothetical protein